MIEPARENQASPGTTQATLKIELRLGAILKLNALERFGLRDVGARRVFLPGLLDSSGMFPASGGKRARPGL